MKTSKKLAIFSLIGLFLIGAPLAVFAVDKQFEQAIHIGADEIIEGNFIRAGNILDINGAVNGDVIVAGNSINISGPVAGDVIAIGNIVRITGDIGGSIRVAGSSVEISSQVARNVWAIGGTVALNEGSKVAWDVFAGGGSVEIKAPIGRNVNVGAGTLVIANEVGKDVMVSLDTDGQLVLYPKAKIGGNLTYKAITDEQLVIKEGAEVAGETNRQNIIIPGKTEWKKSVAALWFFWKITSFFGLLVIGLIFILLMPKLAFQIHDVMVKKPWVSVGWGFGYLILLPVVIFLLMITLIGTPLALITIPLYIIGIYISQIFAAFAVGLLLFSYLNKDKKYKGSLVWPLVVGLLLMMILCMIPFIGWIVKLLLILWALGGIVQIKKEIIQEYC